MKPMAWAVYNLHTSHPLSIDSEGLDLDSDIALDNAA